MSVVERAKAGAQVLVDDLELLDIEADDFHHLQNVLRLRLGEAVVATNGAGSWRACAWMDGLRANGDVKFEAQSDPLITVGFALTKRDKPELVVQKLTEIGVDVIRPVLAERTVVKWDPAKAQANVERFRRIAREAAMQSRRVWLPVVDDVIDFGDILRKGPIVADAGGESVSLDHAEVYVGPEGGWSEAELSAAAGKIDLGPNILRAETAALAVAVQLVDLRRKRTFRSESPT